MNAPLRRLDIVAAALVAALLLVLLWPAPPARAQLGPALVELLERQLERTDAVLERVAPQVQEANRPRVQSLLDEAIALQKIARQLFADIDSGPAVGDRGKGQRILANTQRARDLALQAERRVREEASLEERARLQIERGRRAFEELRDRVASPSDQQRHLMEEAARLLDTAERHFQDQSFEVALRLADSANALLRGVVVGLGPRLLNREHVERELQRTRDLIERATQQRDRLNDAQHRRLEDAVRLQERAEDALRLSRPALSLELTLEARALVRGLLAPGGEAVTAEDVSLALDRLDAKLEQLRADGGADWSPAVRKLVDDSLAARQRALDELARENPAGALAQMRLALDLLGRAARELEGQRP